MAKPEDTLTLETTKGKVVIAMRPDLAPGHVARIKELVRQGFYDGIVFHRVIDGFMAQTGCPHGTGTGGSGKKLKAEFNKEPHVRGTVSMARAASPIPATASSSSASTTPVPRRPVHRLGQRDRGHGERRQDQARRAGQQPRQDRHGDDGGVAPNSLPCERVVKATATGGASQQCRTRLTSHPVRGSRYSQLPRLPRA